MHRLPEPLNYTIDEAVIAARISRRKLYGEISAGRLAARKCGRRTVIPADELRRFIATLPEASAAA